MSAIPSSFEHFVMFRRAFIATRGPQEEKARLIHRVGYLGGCFEIGSGAGRKGPAPGRILE